MQSLVGREDLLARAQIALTRAQGALLVGDAGIGKSAIARSLTHSLAAEGWHVEPIRCSEMTSALSFASLMHLIPPDANYEPGQLGNALADTILARAADNQPVLVIDDLHHVDPGSASVIFSLVMHHGVRIVASTRSRHIDAPSVRTLASETGIERIDIGPLASDRVGELAQQITGQPPDPELVSELVRRAAGNPFYTVALTRAGRDAGAIRELDGYSTLIRPLPAATEVTDLLRSQVSALGAEQHALLQVIAVGEGLPTEVCAGVDGQRAVEGLEAAGLVTIDLDSPTRPIRCAHPLVGEYVRSRLAPERRTLVHQTIIDRVAEYAEAGPLDTLRVVCLGLDAGADVPATTLIEGAEVALQTFELERARAAAHRACEVEPSAVSHLLLGTAHAMTGRVADANKQFELASGFELNEMQRAQIAVAQSRMALFYEFDPERSTALLEGALQSLSESGAKAHVGAALIFPLFTTGQYRQAVDLCTELASYEDLEPAIEVTVLSMLTMGRFMMASFDGLDDIIARGYSLLERAGGHDILARVQLQLGEGITMAARGDFARSMELVHEAVDLYTIATAGGGVKASFSAMLAALQIYTGGLSDAARHTAVAIEETKTEDPLSMAPTLVATNAVVLCQLGRSDEARVIIDNLAPDYFATDFRSAFWKAWADAWLLADDDPVEAAASVASICLQARATGMNYWSWSLLYSAVHFGQPQAVVDQFEDEYASSPCVLSALLSRHARAAADRDPGALVVVARDFCQVGAWASAAAAYAVAAEIEAERGNDPAANRAAVQASIALDQCGRQCSPVLDAIVNPLTEPEFEVAKMASAGQASKAIGDARFVSARTVDNQLRSVYKKLGISGRAELTGVFDLASPTPE